MPPEKGWAIYIVNGEQRGIQAVLRKERGRKWCETGDGHLSARTGEFPQKLGDLLDENTSMSTMSQ